MGELRERTVLVTGASRGIGLATARRLGEAGCRVVMVARTEAPLAAAAAEIGGTPVVADVSMAEGVERVRNAVHAAFDGPPDAIVNAAGTFAIAAFAETSPAEFDRQIAANLRAPFLVIRAFLPELLERGAGHVVNVGSIAGRVPLAGNAAYGAAKFGLHGLHRILVEELRGSGVRATLVEPAATDTPLWDALDPDGRGDLPARAQMLRPDDVARAIVFALEQPPTVEVSYLAVRANA